MVALIMSHAVTLMIIQGQAEIFRVYNVALPQVPNSSAARVFLNLVSSQWPSHINLLSEQTR